MDDRRIGRRADARGEVRGDGAWGRASLGSRGDERGRGLPRLVPSPPVSLDCQRRHGEEPGRGPRPGSLEPPGRRAVSPRAGATHPCPSGGGDDRWRYCGHPLGFGGAGSDAQGLVRGHSCLHPRALARDLFAARSAERINLMRRSSGLMNNWVSRCVRLATFWRGHRCLTFWQLPAMSARADAQLCAAAPRDRFA
jgi:hypothetical protein